MQTSGSSFIQVFEYCTTDLKKFMDRTGKGPSNPLPKELIKASTSHDMTLLSTSTNKLKTPIQ